MTTMIAWQYRSSAGPIEENLSLSTPGIPKPKINDNEVLVEVYSTALNPVEHKILELGFITKMILRSPVTPGMDVCGRVVEVGNKVDSFHTDDIVYGACNGVFGHGALAQFVPVSKDALALVPEGLKADNMASIASVGTTAYQGLKPHIKAGDKVFINGGSGGTGVMSIQIAKALGAHVTTSCSTANIELCRSLGADEVLDYKSAAIIEQLKGKGQVFDLVLDNIGSPYNLYRESHAFLVPDGNFIQVGLGMNLSAMKQLIGNMVLPGLFGGGKRKYSIVMAKPNSADFEQLAVWMKEGNR
jgi:NADPH:quinone reductase-like Zn-dependent oxidoreductase